MEMNYKKCDRCGFRHYEGIYCNDATRGYIKFGKHTYAVTLHNEQAYKQLEQQKANSGFHWKDDVYFKRLSDGSVRIRQFTYWSYNPIVEDWVISEDEWETIVRAMKEG